MEFTINFITRSLYECVIEPNQTPCDKSIDNLTKWF